MYVRISVIYSLQPILVYVYIVYNDKFSIDIVILWLTDRHQYNIMVLLRECIVTIPM